MGLSLQHLQRYHDEGNDFLQKIVAGNEMWCHLYKSEFEENKHAV
jgi:hypothetical protein